MKKYINRVLYRSPGKQLPFLIYPFLLMTAAPGFAYVFFSSTNTVSASILFTLTSVTFGSIFVSVWGVAAVVAVLLALVNIVFRKKWAGRSAPMLGFMVWLYALIIYLDSSFILQAIGYAIPQMLFWAWHYVRVEQYWRNVENGTEEIT